METRANGDCVMTKKEKAIQAETMAIPTFLNRVISKGNVSVGFETVGGKLFKKDSEGNLYDANTNKLKKGKK
jgi:hypothetical protein